MDKNSTFHIIIDAIPSSGLIESLSASLVPVVAIIGSIIAYQQYKINQQRLKHELYDRRLIIFKHMKTYLSEIFSDGNITYERALKFNFDTLEASFLFEDKIINQRITDIYDKSIEMDNLYKKLYPKDGSNGLPAGEERSKIAEEHSKILKWHRGQLKELESLFSKHLGLKA